jgi:exosortase A
MPPEAVLSSPAAEQVEVPQVWRSAGLRLGLVWLALIALFAGDWLAMARQWWDSSTYNHILLVPPIIAWLVWQRWPEVREVAPRPSLWGLVPLAMAVFGWVLGTFASFDLLRQAGAVAMLPSTALLLLGPRSCAALFFPLCYMVFLVPFGDELVPPLQTITAILTIFLVGVSGIPAVIEGVFIDTPAGLFEVAEACSGVKFLIAMIALGVLVANIGFRSWKRRAAFMALCIVVPIIANGIRAWGTIFAAQHVGIEKAAGIDHLIYGWVFFAIVIAAVLGLSWKFFDRSRDEAMIDPAAINASAALGRWEGRAFAPAKAVIAAAALIVAGLGWSYAAQQIAAPMPRTVDLPQVTGWQRVDFRPAAPWEPRALGADHRLLGSYANAAGQKVDVFYALYAAQAEGREAGGFGQGALIPDGTWSWSSNVAAPARGKGEVLVHKSATERLAHTWYRTDSLLTGSNARLKLANIADRLFLRAHPTAVLILSSEREAGRDPAEALRSFESAVGEIGPWMDRIGEQR